MTGHEGNETSAELAGAILRSYREQKHTAGRGGAVSDGDIEAPGAEPGSTG